MLDWTLIYLILIVGACLQSIIGFGLGLLGAPLIFLIAPELVPAPMILNALLLTLILALNHSKNIDMKRTGVSILGGTFGVICAGSVFLFMNTQYYQLIFGLSILVSVALSLRGFTPRINSATSLVAATLSGFMGTITSAGGAPMGLLYQTENKEKIKANLSVFFVYINAFGILVLLITGAADVDDFILFLKCIPALVIGRVVALSFNKRVNETMIQKIILLVATFSGLLLVLNL